MIDDDEAYGLHCDIGRLEQENARLRELIYDRAHEHAIQHMTEDELRITLANTLDECKELREFIAKLMYAAGWERGWTDEQEEAQGKLPM